MPAEVWTEVQRITGCGLLVAAGAVPVGVAAWLLARRTGQPLLPPPKPWRVPWSGLEIIIVFLLTIALPGAIVAPLLSSSGFYPAVYGHDVPEKAWLPMRVVWTHTLFVAPWIGVLWLAARSLYPNWRPGRSSLAPRIALGVAGWLVLHPVVLAVHFTVNVVCLAIGAVPDHHPLEDSFRSGRPFIDQILFVANAAILAPWLEEVQVRGILLPWLLSRRYRVRVMLLITAFLAVPLSWNEDDGALPFRLGPVIFAFLLLIGAWLIPRFTRRKLRTIGAIYTSAAFFGVMHSTVWPTPIPLFVLGLGLGWLAVRTRGILAPVIVHGLFNAVSVLFVLRGP